MAGCAGQRRAVLERHSHHRRWPPTHHCGNRALGHATRDRIPGRDQVACTHRLDGLTADQRACRKALIHDDGLEPGHPRQPLRVRKRLHRRDDHGCIAFIPLSLDDANIQGAADHHQLLHRLRDQLVPVGQHERPPRPAFHQVGQHDRFARTGRKNDHLTPDAARFGRVNSVDRLLLVGPQRQCRSGRWLKREGGHDRGFPVIRGVVSVKSAVRKEAGAAITVMPHAPALPPTAP
jgi:hypothetical protein